MKWYDGKKRLIYGPKTTQAIYLTMDWIYENGEIMCVNNSYPLHIAQIIDKYDLMTDEIRKELEDYIFVDV